MGLYVLFPLQHWITEGNPLYVRIAYKTALDCSVINLAYLLSVCAFDEFPDLVWSAWAWSVMSYFVAAAFLSWASGVITESRVP